MATGGKRKTKHELTEQEIEFYKELSTALYNIRSASGRSVPEMAKRCGYSTVHIRNLENFDLEDVSPIPAYILAVYAEACGAKPDDFFEGWLNRKDKPAVKETHARRIKYITVGENDLLQRIAADDAFGVTLEELENILQPEKYTGRAKEQTEDFLSECVAPVLEKYKDVQSDKPEINV